jgi:glycosyltransferase involved in cell wall biosynthesis
LSYRVALVTHYLNDLGGGVTQVVRDLEHYLSKAAAVEVFGLNGSTHAFSSAKGIGFQRYGLDLTLSRRIVSWKPDIIHLHGIFTFVSHSALVSSGRCDVPLIVSPHGMLDSWALKNSRFKKQVFLALLENRVLKLASRVHALNSAEQFALYEIINSKNKVCVIPNGISCLKVINQKCSEKRFKLLYLGRLHFKKGISELLQGLCLLKRSRPDLLRNLEVNLVGWGDESYVAQMKRLTRSFGLTDFVYFRGPAFDEDKERYFATADAFILPSFSEGLPMAVLEAWSYALPVLMTPECNLPEGFENQAAMLIRANPESLASSIDVMLETPREKLRAMGRRGLELVRHKFSWDSVTRQYLSMYDEVFAEHEAKKLSKFRV